MIDDYFSITIGENEDAIDIGQMVDGITNITRDIGNTWSNVLTPGTGRYGGSFSSATLGSKPISIEFTKNLSQNEMALWREQFASAVDCPNGPRKLIFNDQPNRYYWVVVDGSIAFTYDVGTLEGKGTVSFLVPDGLAHGSVDKLLDKTTTNATDIGSIIQNEDGSVTATLINQGSAEAYPIIKINNKTQNDYIGLVNANGIMEIGNKQDPTNMNLTTGNNVSILNIKQGDSSATTGWGKFVAAGDIHDPMVSDFASKGGSLHYGTKDPTFKSGLCVNALGVLPTSSDPNYYPNWWGGFSKFVIPNDSAGASQASVAFTSNLVMKFWEGLMGQTGIFDVIFTDINDIPIFSYLIYKNDTVGDASVASFRYNASYPIWNESVYKEYVFGANNNESNQSNKNVTFNSAKGQVVVQKNGANISWSYNGQTSTITIAALTNAAVAKIYIGIGRYREQRAPGLVNTMVINSIDFVRNNVSQYKSAPNLYQEGSTNVIDMSSGDITYILDSTASTEGTSSLKDLVDGSEPFSIPKGSSQIKIVSSTWADWVNNPPDVSIEWTENYI